MKLNDIIQNKDYIKDLIIKKNNSIYWIDYVNFVGQIIDLSKLISLSDDELLEQITNYPDFVYKCMNSQLNIDQDDLLAFGIISGLLRFYCDDGLIVYRYFKQLELPKIIELANYYSNLVGKTEDKNLNLRDDFKKLIIDSVELTKSGIDENSRLKFKYLLKDKLFILTENFYKSILIALLSVHSDKNVDSLSKENIGQLYPVINNLNIPFKDKIIDNRWKIIRNAISHIGKDRDSISIDWNTKKIKFIDKSDSYESDIKELINDAQFIFNYRQYIHFTLAHIYFCKINDSDLIDIDI